MPDALVQADFEPCLQRTFAVASGGAAVELVLAEVSPLPASGREGGSFRLEFHGPSAPVLPQATYAFDLGGGEPCDVFIVPIGPADGRMRYEAIFF